MGSNEIFQNLRNGPSSDRTPAIFIGHGSPMNAIADNPFTQALTSLGAKLERPAAALVVSAHWLTPGTTRVSTNPSPPTIHDFGGFPEELFQQRYPVPGAPELARLATAAVASVRVHEDHEMGLDHGAWSVLKHIWPNADVPVFQLSINWGRPPSYHYALARELRGLREKGVLILGSGNVVHNLGRLNWQAGAAPVYDWALEFDRFVRDRVAQGDHQALVDYERLGATALAAHPTNDHYLPLLYTLGVAHPGEVVSEIYSGIEMGSVSMRSFSLAQA
ncbi:MAG: 4,5-DOPA dioxygenase extradiol [Flavobacteriales bacterium]|nr:4,5-DOPA dioxygenase extradiol [Flavobacteriales bacterium]